MSKNGIEFILNLLDISSIQMSRNLNIDPSLISKWKNGTRKIDINNGYFEKLIDYLIDRNESIGINLLENFFNDISKYGNDNLRTKLKKFIINDDFELSHDNNKYCSDEQIVPVKIFNGEETIKKGMLEFLDYAISLKSPRKIILSFISIFDYYMKDEEFRSTWVEKITQLLNRKFVIELIVSSYNNIKSILFISKLILHEYFHIYYDTYPNDKHECFSIHLIENKRILFNFIDNSKNKHCNYCALYQDLFSLRAYTAMLYKMKLACNTIFNDFTQSSFLKKHSFNIYSEKLRTYFTSNSSYYYNLLPSYLLMNDELFYSVLTQSFDSQELIDKELERFKMRKRELIKEIKENTLIHFYPINYIKNMLDNEVISFGEESTISHPPLKVSNLQFRQHLRDVADFVLEHDNFHICLVTEEQVPFFTYIHCWCKRNELLCLYDNENPSTLKISKNISFVNVISDMIENYYMYCSKEFKENQLVAQILKKI